MTIYEYGNPDADTVLIQLTGDHELSVLKNEVEEIRKRTSTDFRLIAAKVDDWNYELSPWKAPAVFGNEDFGDGAVRTLEQILTLCTDKSRTYYIGGYSLAGLFSLWAAYQTDVFSGIAAASPSVWFPGFIEYMKEHEIKSETVYLSLGDREEKTRNSVMSQVGNCIRMGYGWLIEHGINCNLEWNQGNHFREPDIRIAKAFAWVMEGNNMWILFAFGSALFAGLTAILAKCGIRNTDSNVATALRTGVVLVFSWLMVFVVGAQSGIRDISAKVLIFLILSGLSTGISWLCYFKALQIGDINKVTPIDKSSTVITMLLAFIFLREEITWLKFVSMILIGIGTYLMIQKKETKEKAEDKKWLLYAVGSAVFASLTSILGKIGIQDVNSNLGTAIRTAVVLVMAWIVVFVTGKQNTVNNIDRKSWLFLILSGVATGGSWLCYYRALQTGPASVVVPIDKLSILVTIAFSYIVFHEKLSLKSGTGLLLIVVGTLALLI